MDRTKYFLPFNGDFSANEWHQMHLSTIVPDDAYYMNVGVVFTQPNSEDIGGVYVDQVELYENNDDYYTSYVEGFVYDDDGNPIEGVRMYAVADDQSYVSRHFNTNFDGYYRIPIIGDRGYFIGASQSINLIHTDNLTVYLNINTLKLDRLIRLIFILGLVEEMKIQL